MTEKGQIESIGGPRVTFVDEEETLGETVVAPERVGLPKNPGVESQTKALERKRVLALTWLRTPGSPGGGPSRVPGRKTFGRNGPIQAERANCLEAGYLEDG